MIDSVEPQDYAYETTGVAGEIFYIEQIDVSGHSDLHGPFALGVAHGSRFEANPTETESHLYLPSVQDSIAMSVMGPGLPGNSLFPGK